MSYNLFLQGDLDRLRSESPERFSDQNANYINLQALDLAPIPGIDVPRLEKLARITRGLMFAALEAGQSGHPGGSSAKTEQFLALALGGVMAFDPMDPKHPGRDRLVWSAGHCTPLIHGGTALLYEALRRNGRQFSNAVIKAVFPEDLLRFRHPDGPQGHAEHYQPYVDISTGSSGHGLSAAGGIAIAHKSSGLDTKVWVLMGDAETEEGMSYEARNILSTNRINNLIVSLDRNHFGIDGDTDEVINSPYINHWLGLGWNVIEINGHNFLEIIYAYYLARQGFENSLPTAVMANCVKGKFYGSKENSADSHGSPAKHDEYVAIMKKLGFNIPGTPDNVMPDLEVVLNELSPDDEAYIAARLEEAAKRVAPEAKLVEKMKSELSGRPIVRPSSIKRPEILPKELAFAGGSKAATRKATQAWFKWMMEQTAFFYVGAGDLAKSILTSTAEGVYGLISKDNPLGRGIRFGIAEQNMAMMSAAMTQDALPGGFQPVSVFSSYGVFTSMMANAVRMALIGNHIKPETQGFFIMLAAHDGPETGEDGPTHQGLFWMSLYTAYPGIKVYKPMDANETIEMLFYALAKGEPIALSVARPDTPVFTRGNGAPEAREAINGAYVFRNFQNNGGEKITLAICGGQILANTLEIVPQLETEGLDVKIVAVTSPELFEDLRRADRAKADSIFSEEDRTRVITLHNGWPGFLYPFILPADYDKRALGIDQYLKSGNVKEVYELAGLTGEEIKVKIINGVKHKVATKNA